MELIVLYVMTVLSAAGLAWLGLCLVRLWWERKHDNGPPRPNIRLVRP